LGQIRRVERRYVWLDEARSTVKAGLALNPTYVISLARAHWAARSDDPTYLGHAEGILEGMRKAGVPEMTAARRLAAILAADVVGYSRLMGGDGEGGQRASRRQPVR